MEQAQRIYEIKARALNVGLSLGQLCALAGVSRTSLWRWKREDANPGLRLLADTLAKLETALAAREREVLAELARRHPDVVERLAA